MKTPFLTLLLATLCATGYGQTIKALGYDTASGEVVANTGTNALTFTNQTINIDNIGNDGSVVWDVFNNTFEIETSFKEAFSFVGTNASNARATSRASLGLGPTNDVTFQSVYIEGESFIIASGTNQFFYAGSDVVEIFLPVNLYNQSGLSFQGTNAAAAAATTRTNLGIPLPALTNTSNVTFQGAIFPATTTNAPTNTNAPTPDAWLDIQVGTNSYKLPLWQ